jgi:hypothetical protein
MRRAVSTTLQVIALAAVSLWLGEAVWWSGWMNDGWPAPPNVLAHVLGADGEAAYDAQGDQMALAIFAVLLVLWLGARMYLASRWRVNRGEADV